ncbi:MAG: ComF family protein [Lachnospiraceae bacterium]|nr:ComF family protein [Lachnospiraceae bacterium]
MSKRTILDILFPRRCPVCGEIVKPAGGLICPPCFQKLSFVTGPVCKKCGKEIADGTMEFCEDCMAHRHTFESGVALLNYDEIARKSMVQMKYNNKREYLDFYGEAMAIRYETVIRRMQVDVIVPVPVHRSRRRKRGFNQAELLAEILGKKLNIPVENNCLRRDRRTLPQKELSPTERLKNLTGAFRAETLPKHMRRILLVDDIYTTGSTLEACARALKRAGAENVYFAVICMTGGR